jgi:hypothetical protein
MVIEALHRPQRCVRLRVAVTLVAGSALLLALLARFTSAQSPAPGAPSGGAVPAGNAALHMEMSPTRAIEPGDSARAAAVARQLRTALMKYRDTSAAVADGYRMFLPQVKVQRIYHFTNNWRAVQEGFRFDPTRPTSILYRRAADGTLELVGAMYTAPKRFAPDKLDERVPLSIARWHKHVDWCVPRRGEARRWLEQENGSPVFGPESPIATKEACDRAGGVFHPVLFGWMLHANVFAGDDASTIWGDDHGGRGEHAGHGMHEGMMTPM